MGGTSKAEKTLDDLAAKYGFVRDDGYTGKGRIKYVNGSSIVFASATNHDRRALQNLESQFRSRS